MPVRRVSIVTFLLGLLPAAAFGARTTKFDEITGALQPDQSGYTNLVGNEGSFRLVAPGYNGEALPQGDLGMFGSGQLILRGLRYRAGGEQYFVVQQFGPAEVGRGYVAGRVNAKGTSVGVAPSPNPRTATPTTLRLPKWAVKLVQGGLPKGHALYERVGVIVPRSPDNPTFILISPQPFPSDKISIRPRTPSKHRRSGMQSPGFDNTPGYNHGNDVRGVAFVKDGVNWVEVYRRSYAGGEILPALKQGRQKVRAFKADSLTQEPTTPVMYWQLPQGAKRAPVRSASGKSPRR